MSIMPGLAEIRKKRKKAGLSQKELASLVGISQSHLAKIEIRKVDPSYSLVARVFDALDQMNSDECWQYMSKEILSARKGDEVKDVELQMKTRGFSQVPVFDKGMPIGMLTERRILEMKKPYEKLLVEDSMEETAIVPKETSYLAIIPLLRQFQAVLVHDCGKVVGIITNTDLIGHKKKFGN